MQANPVEMEFQVQSLDFAVYDVNCSRGAPMGRVSGVWTSIGGRRQFVDYYNDLPFKLQLQKVPMVDGAYDQGGAYWGAPNNLYAAFALVWLPKVERELEIRWFIRANSRDEAKAKTLEIFPNASFYR